VLELRRGPPKNAVVSDRMPRGRPCQREPYLAEGGIMT
jgi:hypothetical protein